MLYRINLSLFFLFWSLFVLANSNTEGVFVIDGAIIYQDNDQNTPSDIQNNDAAIYVTGDAVIYNVKEINISKTNKVKDISLQNKRHKLNLAGKVKTKHKKFVKVNHKHFYFPLDRNNRNFSSSTNDFLFVVLPQNQFKKKSEIRFYLDKSNNPIQANLFNKNPIKCSELNSELIFFDYCKMRPPPIQQFI